MLEQEISAFAEAPENQLISFRTGKLTVRLHYVRSEIVGFVLLERSGSKMEMRGPVQRDGRMSLLAGHLNLKDTVECFKFSSHVQ